MVSASEPEPKTGEETNEKEVEEKDDDETEEKVCRAVPNFLKAVAKKFVTGSCGIYEHFCIGNSIGIEEKGGREKR